MKNCIFCNIEKEKVIAENTLAIAFFDDFPVSLGHILVVPKRHVESFFDLSTEEIDAIYELLRRCKTKIEKLYKPDGYNIGINVNEAGGQSVFHVHVHLIPRYLGDVKNPRGGVRGVIPEKQSY